MLAIMIRGLILIGGFSSMWSAAESGGRLNFFNFSGDVFERHTFWNLIFGSLILWGSPYATSQFMIHRCLCLDTETKGKYSLYVNFIGQILMLLVVTIIGLTLYTFYQVNCIDYKDNSTRLNPPFCSKKDCDPVSAGLISSNDAIVPFFVSQEFSDLPGMSGLFVACLFSGALSSLDSGTKNSLFLSNFLFSILKVYILEAGHGLATVTFEELSDFPKFRELTYGKETLTLRLLSILYGVLSTMLAFLCSNLGSIIQMAGTLMGGCLGPMFAFVLIAILLPFVNLKGSILGEVFFEHQNPFKLIVNFNGITL